MTIPKQIEFNRPAKYTAIEVLGSGACGETVRIRDEGMACDFVAKKYKPIISESEQPELFNELLARFREEARILFRLNHPNIVRVFNFFDYIENKTAYIIMEFISGLEIVDHLRNSPAMADKAFEGVVEGFVHLQAKNVLHRDIRPANFLVDASGVPKIIDFGFGKSVDFNTQHGEHKSISLNWWCDTPPEFEQGIYDFQTEVYFVGKLFELAISECRLTDFKYRRLVAQMCEPDRDRRTKLFSDLQRTILEGKFEELSFLESEVQVYRNFADELIEVVSSIHHTAQIERDSSNVLLKLEEVYRKTMLEERLSAPNTLARIFIIGQFRFFRSASVQVSILKKFIDLLRSISEEKRSIVLDNIAMRFEGIERTGPDLDDEIPF